MIVLLKTFKYYSRPNIIYKIDFGVHTRTLLYTKLTTTIATYPI